MSSSKTNKNSKAFMYTLAAVGVLLTAMTISASSGKTLILSKLTSQLTQSDRASAAMSSVTNLTYNCSSANGSPQGNFSWSYQGDKSAVTYLFRADRTSDPWTDACPLFASGGGDVCQNGLSSTTYSIPMTSGVLYHVWVQVRSVITGEISGPFAIGAKCSGTSQTTPPPSTPAPSVTPGNTPPPATSTPRPTTTPTAGPLLTYIWAERFNETGGPSIDGVSGVRAVGGYISNFDAGDYVRYDNVNLYFKTGIRFWASSRAHNGYVEVRADSPTGRLLATWYPVKTQEPGQPKVFSEQHVPIAFGSETTIGPRTIYLIGKNNTYGLADISAFEFGI